MHSVTSNAVASAIIDSLGAYNQLNVSSSTNIKDIPKGYWRLSSGVASLVTNKPSWYTGGVCFLLVTNLGDENFILFFSPKDQKISIQFQYGTWRTWKNILT